MKSRSGLRKFNGPAALLVLALSGAAQATTLLRMSVEQMTGKAQAIVRARCLGNSTRWEEGEIWTFASFDVKEAWLGATAPRITVRLLGGRAGDLTSSVSGVPRFQPGEEVILFLEPTGRGDFSVVSWQQGTFRIRRGASPGGEAVTQDTAASSTFDPAAQRFAAGGIRSMPLGAFRARVQAALRTRGTTAP